MSSPFPIEAIDAGFIAAARPDVIAVDVDGEMVLYDDSRRVLHRLNPTASALWQCLDGTGTLGEIAGDIAEVFGVDRDQVLTDVLAAARQFGKQGLLIGVGDSLGTAARPSRAEEGDGGPFVPEPPTSCMDSSFTLGEAGSMTVRAGPHLLGLRVSTLELARAARAVLQPGLVPGIAAPPNVSVVETKARAGRPLFYCYRSGWLITRARSPRRAMEAAVTLLSSYGNGARPHPRIRALVAIRDGQTALFCPECQLVADRLPPRLRAAGWDLADSRGADLDSKTGDVVIPRPAVALDDSALAALALDESDGRAPAPGRYPARAWVAVATDSPPPETAAARVVAVAAGSDSLGAGSGRSVLLAIRTMLQGAAWVVSPTLDAAAIVHMLTEAVS